MKKSLLLLFLPLSVFCQNTIGFPDIINYTKQTYSAGLQNWDIKQDKNGLMYFANNEGLLTFDGITWNLYPLPNKTIVRSVEIGFDNKIYVGGQDEFGYFSPNSTGFLQYTSLTSFLSLKDKSFGDVWDIITYNKNIFFRANHKIFKLSNKSIEVYNAFSEWSLLTVANGKLYAHDLKGGLKSFEQNNWSNVITENNLLINDPLTSILPINKDSLLITTLKHGIFYLNKGVISKLNSVNNPLFEEGRIYAANKINEDWIALATSNNGVYIIDFKGNIIQSFSKTEGLQNNDVLSIFIDNQHNLWLGLDNGIDLITYNNAIKLINPFLKDGSGYAATIYNSNLFVGTSNGLYSMPLNQNGDLSFNKGNFKPVINAKGQTWCLSVINNQLLLGNHEGAFVIKDNTAIPITQYPGYWNFTPISTNSAPSEIISGNYNGLSLMNYKNEKFAIVSDLTTDFHESSRFVAIDKYNNIWVSHPYHGVYKIHKNNNNNYLTESYSTKKGLPSLLNNQVFKVKNEVVFATEKGIYSYNPQKDCLEASTFYNKILGNRSIRYLKEDNDGNIWFIHEKTLGVIYLSTTKPVVNYFPELTGKLLSGFEFIYPLNQNNIFVGGAKGFYLLNYEKYKHNLPTLTVQVREVRIINGTDSLLFGGFFKDVNDIQIQEKNKIPQIKNDFKTIRFQFSASLYGYQSNLEYSYRLKGFDNNFCTYTKRTEKEYTNLPAGSYHLEIKVRNNLGKESAIAIYSFTILPPWYLTIWAIILYAIIFILGNYMAYLWLKNKFRAQRARYESEQKRLLYIHELEISKTESEIVSLRNEKLESEIDFKNSELASSAMHLLKKGELLTKIKSGLSQLIKEIDNTHAIAELKKMVKTLNEDEHLDEEWENFSNHFDKVHSDFLSELKEIHPNVSANELKLSAYLRMNLSTKEIAQLMNISVRGVEISRYRLRKKLAIPTETTLFDYLINLKGKS